MASPIQLKDPSGNEFLAQLESRSGKANHFFRTMAYRPEVLKNFVPLYGAVMGPGVVERRTKELVYLTASFANRCLYCSTAHRATGGKAGVTGQEMAALEVGDSAGFSGAELAAIQYAAALTGTATADRGPLEAHFSQEQIVELTLVCAMANFTNRFNNGLSVQPE